ncbi:ABC transporter substrate-binding protein [Bifidobacterium simiarum]|uniref:Sugar ABC transporter substrate-binding protein n=1 Tax=Bifidobacterium simiarum TaxID=2045441 RepID=A0A2M9HFU0_9BIFI|nr:extracellular solute-binding protein [Bifidobacterium simiarum]PJM75682.1 sugar ABC transporter substrate-binding protein [Bifidobacterium simiarum]
MKLNRIFKAVAVTSVLGLALAGCGGGGSSSSSSSDAFDKNAKTEITMAGWSLDSTPEFKTLADAFMAKYPNVKVNIKQYSADDYDKQMTADISAGSQPDVFPIKNLQKYLTYSQSQGLADLSDIAAGYKDDKNIDISNYELDGKYYAMPYRQDSWVLFYNKDMMKKAGVDTPTDKWTWDDYTKAAEQLKTNLPKAGYDAKSVYPIYQHNWQSVVQAFALAQTGYKPDTNFFKAKFDYMKPFYERALKWQDEKLTIDWNTSKTTSVQYQAQFGTQKAAMLPMGTWYAATLVQQQKSGDAEKFSWGIAPIPQNPDSSSSDKPVTFGDPTGLAVSAKSEGQKLAAAKEFVKFASGEDGAKALAKIATTPAYFSDAVADTYFGVDGMATDDLTKEAWQNHDTKPENPVGEGSDTIISLLNDAHSSIMTETSSVNDALAKATQDIKDQGIVTE